MCLHSISSRLGAHNEVFFFTLIDGKPENGSNGGGIFKSLDGGESWNPVEMGVPVVRVVVPNAESWTVFHMHTGRGVFGGRIARLLAGAPA
jgi:hypothetical protein